jgi:hypothetical protein
MGARLKGGGGVRCPAAAAAWTAAAAATERLESGGQGFERFMQRG